MASDFTIASDFFRKTSASLLSLLPQLQQNRAEATFTVEHDLHWETAPVLLVDAAADVPSGAAGGGEEEEGGAEYAAAGRVEGPLAGGEAGALSTLVVDPVAGLAFEAA